MPGATFDDFAVTIGAERQLDDQRARIERQLAALSEVEAAVGRYRSLCPADPCAAREEASRTGAEGSVVPECPTTRSRVLEPRRRAGGEGAMPATRMSIAVHEGGPGRARMVPGSGHPGGGPDRVRRPPSGSASAAAPSSSRAGVAASRRSTAASAAAGMRSRSAGSPRRNHDPEPLAILLSAPMPVVAADEAPPAAPVRVRMERGFINSAISNATPISDDAAMRAARLHDRTGDERFVAALAPSLSPEARARAKDVRIKAGDPTAQLLG